jgi:hypothetical protein
MKSVEIKTQNLKIEEEKLNKMKHEVMRESALLEQQKEKVTQLSVLQILTKDLLVPLPPSLPPFPSQASEELLRADQLRANVREAQEQV